ncbi:DNA translocase FtsK [Sphingobium cupriresistens]|uniref:DNA translocase FtsK n=1 Tax=Sphingobium cupriresistens TaxID=1132417 RepID=UPI003BF5DA4A
MTREKTHGTDMYEGHDGRPNPDRPAPSPNASDAERFTEAMHLVIDHQNASTSWLQRQMRIGYNAASRLVEELERHGVVGPPNHLGRRDVLVPPSCVAQQPKGGLKERVAAAVVEAAQQMDEAPLPMSITTGDGKLMFENKAARQLREAADGS